MALWQYELSIIPQEQSNNSKVNKRATSWQNKNILPNIGDAFFSSVLPTTNSWSKNIKFYGKEDSTCVRFLIENDIVDEIFIQLDLRNLSKILLIKILSFIKSIGGVIYSEGLIIQPEINDLVPIMKQSSAAKFCANPSEYLEKMGKELK